MGAALGVLSWGTGSAGWLPATGVHPAPRARKTSRAFLPVLVHAAYGAAWGLPFYALTRGRRNGASCLAEQIVDPRTVGRVPAVTRCGTDNEHEGDIEATARRP